MGLGFLTRSCGVRAPELVVPVPGAAGVGLVTVAVGREEELDLHAACLLGEYSVRRLII